MDAEFKKLESLLKHSRTIAPADAKLDDDFKLRLRTELFTSYIDQKLKGESFWDKIIIFLARWRIASLALLTTLIAVLVVVAVYRIGSRSSIITTVQPKLLAANISDDQGTVELQKAGSLDWQTISSGATISQGDSVRTGENSRVVVVLDNGDAIRLDASSEIQLKSTAASSVVINQVNGESYNRVVPSDRDKFTVEAQGVDAEAYGTAYCVTSDPVNKKVVVASYEHTVKLSLGSEQQYVNEQTQASVDISTRKIVIGQLEQTDDNKDFVAWNQQQDNKAGFSNSQKSNSAQASSGSSKSTATVTVTQTQQPTPSPTPTPKTIVFKLTQISAPQKGQILVKWQLSGITAPYGYKIMLSLHSNPTYPGDESRSVDKNHFDFTWTNLDSGTYHIRVCVYNGTGGCGRYSDDRAISIQGWTGYTSGIDLTSATPNPDNSVTLTWSIDPDGTAPNGFKVIWSTNAAYSPASYHFVAAGLYSYTTNPLPSGTYYFNVGVFHQGTVTDPNSSPDQIVVIP